MKLPALFIARNKGRPNRGQAVASERLRPAIQVQAAESMADKNMRPHQNPREEFDLHSWYEQCDALAKDAIKSGGLSHDWCVELYSSRVDRALELLPEACHGQARQVANEVFDNRNPAARQQTILANAESGPCLHGIPFDCCPVGCGEFPDESGELDTDHDA
jgi:hypothetical protein